MVRADIARIRAAFDRLVAQIMRNITLTVVAELIVATPVDTGWARANWVPGVGSAFLGTAGTRAAAEAGIVNSGPQTAGRAALSGYLSPRQGIVFIANNVPYIVDLNEGTSRQAPAAFVQAAIARGIQAGLRATAR